MAQIRVHRALSYCWRSGSDRGRCCSRTRQWAHRLLQNTKVCHSWEQVEVLSGVDAADTRSALWSSVVAFVVTEREHIWTARKKLKFPRLVITQKNSPR